MEERLQRLNDRLQHVNALLANGETRSAVEMMEGVISRSAQMLAGEGSNADKRACARILMTCVTRMSDLVLSQPVSVNRNFSFLDESDLTSYKIGDIVGMQSAKRALAGALVLPHCMKGIYDTNKRTTGILFFGLPGVGKTALINAICNDCRVQMDVPIQLYRVNLSDITETKKNITALFDAALQNPDRTSLIVIDEIDAFTSNRDDGDTNNVVTQKCHLLNQIDRLLNSPTAVVIGTTNKVSNIDSSFRRRFQKKVYFPLPINEERRQILYRQISSMKGVQLTDHELDDIARKTNQYSPAELKSLVDQTYDSCNWLDFVDKIVDGMCRHDIQGLPNHTLNGKNFYLALLSTIKKFPKNDKQDEIDQMEEWAEKHSTEFNKSACTETVMDPLEYKQFKKKPFKTVCLSLACCLQNVPG